MSAREIVPVILCGGSGTRLWPLSRKSYPKQFTPLFDDDSLYQRTAQRFSGAGFAAPVVVTNSDFRFIVTQQLWEIGIDPAGVLIEPQARNTAPAVLAAALNVARTNPDALMLVTPADHQINDVAALNATLERGKTAALSGHIVTLGVSPTRPETGYGYLEPAGPAKQDIAPLKAFVEKPSLDVATDMVRSGRYLWNAGIFLCRATTLIDAYQRHAPDMLTQVQAALNNAQPDLGFLRLAPEPWQECANISVDYAVMEKADNLMVAAHDGDWTDLGSWDAVHQHSPLDDAGVAQFGEVLAVDCTDTLLRSQSKGLQLVGLGLDNIVAVAMKDAVLVADRNKAAALGDVLQTMRAQSVVQADQFPRDFKPWGSSERLISGATFQVNYIIVNPGAAMRLQVHSMRSEHWVVISGSARVTVDETITTLTENQSVFIPAGSLHRIENTGSTPVELIEVQTGEQISESDVVRYPDPEGE